MNTRPAQPLTQDETTILKGVAILSMIFMHLFNNVGRMEAHGVQDIMIGGAPLSYQISRLCLCVPMYLFLSGYGLYISWQNSKTMRPVRRCLLLYLNFWVICAIFIPLASWLRPETYPGSLTSFISNITAWNPTYNSEWWFLFPYIVLVFLAPLIFPLISKFDALRPFVLAGGVFLASYILSKYMHDYVDSRRWMHNMNNIAGCTFPFVTGAVCAKTHFFALVTTWINHRFKRASSLLQLILLFLVISPFVVQPLLPRVIFGVLFSFIFIFAFINLYRPYWVDKFLTLMGKQSTNMWLIHTFFCYYLFSHFVYSFTYPLLIFLVTLALSYASGRVVDIIYRPLRRMVAARMS